MGGILTGRGADLIIIDDPQKPQDAQSETERASINQWFDNTVTSRLNNKVNGNMILVMQRLHEDDLCGHVQENQHWKVLSLAAVASEDESSFCCYTPLGAFQYNRPAGEVLHAARESADFLHTQREVMGSANFSAQYLQTPLPREGQHDSARMAALLLARGAPRTLRGPFAAGIPA